MISWLGVVLAAAAVTITIRPLGAATTEYLVVNPHTGLAIDGFDPVAYYTEGAALLGRETIEFSYAGAVWRFRNEGNRAAFAADPEIYMPQYGGYDPVDIARGAAVAGNPREWLVWGTQLFFFQTPEARTAFGADRDQIMEAAHAQWPSILRKLSP